MLTRLVARCFVLLSASVVFVPASLFAQPCTARMSLIELVNAADSYVLGGNPRLAIQHCYAPFANSQAFADGDVVSQNRFLFEYLMAADAAATRLLDKSTSEAKTYYLKAQEAGEKYFDWYCNLDTASRSLLERAFPDRPAKAVFALATAYQRLTLFPVLLETFESLTEYPICFSARLLDLWEQYLRRSLVGFKEVAVSDALVRASLVQEPVKERWLTYKVFLAERLSTRPRLVNEVRRRLAALRRLGLTG